MPLADELRLILTIISDMTHDTKKCKRHSNNCRSKPSICRSWKSLKGVTIIGIVRTDTNSPTNVEDRIYKITRKGIKEVYNKEFR